MADVRTLSSMAATNGSAGQSPKPDNTSEAEKDLWRWLEDVSTESARVRREDAQFEDFDEWLDLYYGNHWPSSIPSFRPPVVVNELRTLVLSEASDLTESQPRVYITKDPRKGQRDEQLERAFLAVWARQRVDIKLMQACVWALICGTGFIEIGWDPDAHHGFGDVVVKSRDPRTVLPDPDAIDDETWLYRMIEEVLDIHEIRRMYPLEGMRVRPDDKWSVKDGGAVEGINNPAYVGPLTPNDTYTSNLFPGYKKARARVIDCILKDDSVETMMVADDPDPLTGEERFKETIRAKYPHGRRIVGANGVILYDGPNQYQDFGLVRVVLEPTGDRFWGVGFIQQTAELQLAADKLASNVVENAVRLNNGIIVSTTNTGLDWETFAGIPAQIVQINPGSEFKIQYPPPMPPDMIEAPWRMLDMQRRLLGFQDARSGAPSKGNVSAELTETEISQAQSVTRLRSRMLRDVVQRMAEMIFARMAFGYSQPRAIPAIAGEEFKPLIWEPLAEPDLYAVYVDPASFTIMSKTMLRRMSLLLRKLNVLDRKAVLEAIGWPDADAVAKRMDQAETMAAMVKGGKKK